MVAIRTLDEADVRGKRVLLRVDLNVPLEDGKVGDLTRIERVAPTIREIADKGGKVILLSHFGRPKGPDPKQSLRPIAAAVSQVLGRPVAFAEDCVGPKAQAAVAALRPGDILCLENTRFHKGEESNDPEFVAALAALGDLWVNDAFSAAHRAHPVMAIVGGAKVSTKLDLLGNLIAKVDILAIGGGMANTFLAAQGRRIGKSLAEHDLVTTAREVVAAADAKGREILLPTDAVVARELAPHAPSRVVAVDAVGEEEMILDLGPRSVEHVISALARSKTLLWNGPVGAFEIEPFDDATIEIAEAAAELTEAGKLVSVAGGGDTVAALNAAGVTGRFSYVSTAGGAFLEWLEGKALPGVEVLKAEQR